MATYKLTRFAVKPESRLDAERAMHAHASFVREALADVMWTTYRAHGDSGHYIALTRIQGAVDPSQDGSVEMAAALRDFLVGDVTSGEYELVTSSDLARRSPVVKAGARVRRRLHR